MTNSELSNLFDVLLNSYGTIGGVHSAPSTTAIVLDEYEKSVFLTEAQEKYIKDCYGNTLTQFGFEKTEEDRRKLDSLVKTYKPIEQPSENLLVDDKYKHKVFKIDTSCWFIVYEQVKWGKTTGCYDGMIADILPTPHDIYIRTRNNPFRGPNYKRALRLDMGDKLVELVTFKDDYEYIIRYIAQPEPIILVDLTNTDLDIRNKKQVNPCKLPELVHQDILELAVQMAYQAKAKTQTTKNNNKEKEED